MAGSYHRVNDKEYGEDKDGYLSDEVPPVGGYLGTYVATVWSYGRSWVTHWRPFQ